MAGQLGCSGDPLGTKKKAGVATGLLRTLSGYRTAACRTDLESRHQLGLNRAVGVREHVLVAAELRVARDAELDRDDFVRLQRLAVAERVAADGVTRLVAPVIVGLQAGNRAGESMTLNDAKRMVESLTEQGVKQLGLFED